MKCSDCGNDFKNYYGFNLERENLICLDCYLKEPVKHSEHEKLIQINYHLEKENLSLKRQVEVAFNVLEEISILTTKNGLFLDHTDCAEKAQQALDEMKGGNER